MVCSCHGETARIESFFISPAVAYVLYLILDATEHDALPVFSAAMLYFVLPLTVITLLVLTARAFRGQRSKNADTERSR